MHPIARSLPADELYGMLESGELSVSVWHRRDTLIALTELAAQAKGSHSPVSRARLKTFRAMLDQVEKNDEVEITGEILCETVMLALAGLENARNPRRR